MLELRQIYLGDPIIGKADCLHLFSLVVDCSFHGVSLAFYRFLNRKYLMILFDFKLFEYGSQINQLYCTFFVADDTD